MWSIAHPPSRGMKVRGLSDGTVECFTGLSASFGQVRSLLCPYHLPRTLPHQTVHRR